MGVVFIVAILLIVALVLFGIGKIKVDGDEFKISKFWALVPIAIAALLLAFTCIKTVAPGKVAVPVAFGNTGSEMGSGIHFVAPWVNLKTFSTREEQYTMVSTHDEGDKKGDDSVPVLGKDAGTANVEGTLLYHIGSVDAGTLYKKIGTEFVEKIVRPTARTCIRNEFARYPIVDAATTERDKVAVSIKTCIEQKFSARYLILDDFQLRNVQLSDQLKTAVEEKIAAAQAAEKKIFEIRQAEGNARVTVTNSKATADSQQILACGGTRTQTKDSTGKLVDTVVPNDTNHCNQSQLTPAFLQFQYIQALQKMVDSPNHSTIIMPFDQKLTPLLNVDSTK